MSETSTRRRGAGQQVSEDAGWAGLCASSQSYFIGGKPAYKLLKEFVKVPVVNDASSAYPTAKAAWAELQPRESAIVTSMYQERSVNSLIVHTGVDGARFAGLMHDAKGMMVDTELIIIQVECVKDIKNDAGEVIVPVGKQLIKAVTKEYLERIKAAA